MSFEFDVPDQDPEADEMNCKVTAGFHLARVARTWTDKQGKLKIAWEIESPPWKGHVVIDSFANPALAMTQEEQAGQVRRLWLFAYRMGQCKKEDRGKRLALNEAALVGVRRVIEVERRRNSKKPDDTREYSNIAYDGRWDLDRPEIPVEDRIRLGLALLPGQVAPSAAASPATVVTPPVPSKNAHVTPGVPAMAFDPSEI
jgi:hypothetical protein